MNLQQQRTGSLALSTPEAFSSSRPRSGGLGNAGNQDQMRFVNDIQEWLTAQADLIGGMHSGESRAHRAFGTLSVLVEASRAFQQGEAVDISSLPMAPTATEMPSMAGLLPALNEIVRPYLTAKVASTNGTSVLFASASLAHDEGGGEEEDEDRKGGSLGAIKDAIMALKLKLPGESQRFSLKRYGDADSVEKILRHCVQTDIKSADQVAYILATAWHESRLGKWMTESGWLSEKSAERYAEKKYGPNGSNPSRAKRNGNTNAGDGGRYMGRGYVQLTWKNNYERMSKILIESGYTYSQDGTTYGNGKNGTTKIDLVKNYQHVNRNKDLAARILVLGMDGGHYVDDKKGLDHYIPEDKKATHGNFQSARKIVNGTDKKSLIADNAVTIQGVLRKDNAWTKAYDTAKGKFHGP